VLELDKNQREAEMGILTGQIRCKRCFKTFEWYYANNPNAENLAEVAKGKAAARVVQSNANGEPEIVQARCKHCSEPNRIEVHS
jgi:hypothetical protein